MSRILWVDLETTGTDPERDALIEIGALVTDEKLEILDRFENVIWTDIDEWEDTPKVVLQMHTDNGLLADSLDRSMSDPYEDVLFSFAAWIESQFRGQRQIPLAGSGVSHFDRKWLDLRFAEQDLAVAERFAYWHYDVGCARRLARLTNIDLAEFGYEDHASGANKAHRAMDDIEDHLQEAVAICNAFQFAHDQMDRTV